MQGNGRASTSRGHGSGAQRSVGVGSIEENRNVLVRTRHPNAEGHVLLRFGLEHAACIERKARRRDRAGRRWDCSRVIGGRRARCAGRGGQQKNSTQRTAPGKS